MSGAISIRWCALGGGGGGGGTVSYGTQGTNGNELMRHKCDGCWREVFMVSLMVVKGK